MNGTVVRAVGGFFLVDTNGTTTQCRARGVFRKRGTTVIVGDRVAFDTVSNGQAQVAEGIVTAVEPRSTELVRPPIANCDCAVLVFSARSPDFHGNLLDRTLVSVAMAGMSATVVLSKTDLVSEAEAQRLTDPYLAAGYQVLHVSRTKLQGVNALRELLQGHIAVFAGPSGAGKSSLANLLAPQLGLKMGEISEKLGRGKHTTRHVELFRLGQGTFVADAPGFSQLNLDLDSHELRLYFPEFVKVSHLCEYRGCLHIDEDQCAVKQRVAAGEMSERRYESYRILYEELRKKEERRY